MEEKCKLCGSKFKRLSQHVRVKHLMTMETYDALDSKTKEKTGEPISDVIAKELDKPVVVEDVATEDSSEEATNNEHVELSDDSELGEMSEEEATQVVVEGEKDSTVDSRTDAIWEEPDSKLSLKEFLKEIGISEKELRNLVKRYLSGSEISNKQTTKSREEIAENLAKQFLDRTLVKTNDLYVAGALTDKYDYKCTKVIGNRDKDGNVKSKTWVLEKK